MATREADGWTPGFVVFAGVMIALDVLVIAALTAYSPRSSGMGA